MADRHDEARFTAAVEPLQSKPGLEIVDPIERRRRSFHTASPVSPEPVDADAFPFPVETAVSVEVQWLTLPTAEQVMVRDADGQMVAEVDHGTVRSFEAEPYVLEPSGMLKVYVSVDDGVTVRPEGHSTVLDFGEPTTVRVGCRSTHDRPAATVTTTADPSDVLAAVSTLGSAQKTTSPERSFASFRGHPPTVEIGDALEIPDGLEPPADDLRIEVPAEYRFAYLVAPLAYYLGAPVREGPEPRLVGDGLDHDLAASECLEAGVEQLLKHVFVLECVTRTEGLYRVDLHERDVVEDRVDLPFAELYDAPQAERIAAYLDVPHEAVTDVVPNWRNAAHVEPTVETVEALPYLLDDLALVRIAEPDSVSRDVVESGGLAGVARGAAATTDASFVTPTEQADTLEEAWIGDGAPIGATKGLTEAFENRIGRSPSTGSIDITVVCNADAMTEERDLVDEVYGSRSDLPFDVTVHHDVTTDELADLLAVPRDLLHYVGHIEAQGFECVDGHLDVAALDDVGVDAFFLNACRSYDQGMELIRSGAIGGIVTISDVVNFGAIRIGRAVARLLNCGFPLRPALEVAREESVVGSLYVVVGDGGLSIVQSESGTPLLLDIYEDGDDYAVQIEMYGAETGIGGLCYPHAPENEQYYLASSVTPPIPLAAAEAEEFVTCGESPIRFDGALTWPESFAESEL